MKPNIQYELNEGAILSAITSVSERDWATFFEICRKKQYEQLRGAQTDLDRQRLQANVQGFDLIQSLFLSIQKDKKLGLT